MPRIRGRKTEAKNKFTVRSHSAFVEFQIIHTVNDFSQSLLDFLESRVMRRKSINHCVYVNAYKYENITITNNVLRMFRETHAISARSSSTTRIREKALRNESLDQNNARDCLQSCGYSGKWTSFLPFRVQLLGCESLLLRTQLHRQKDRTQKTSTPAFS